MEDIEQSSPSRVGVYLKTQTRNRLNKFKADLSYANGEIIPLDKVVNMLLDHYAKTAPKPVARVLEPAL